MAVDYGVDNGAADGEYRILLENACKFCRVQSVALGNLALTLMLVLEQADKMDKTFVPLTPRAKIGKGVYKQVAPPFNDRKQKYTEYSVELSTVANCIPIGIVWM